MSFNGWRIESPIDIDGARYILDAIRPDTRKVREFVHSLSPYYEKKHISLRDNGFDVAWIFDGVSKGGIKNFLKPRALMLWRLIGGMVHYESCLWRHWQDDVWFPAKGNAANEVMERYRLVGSREVAR
jgi:hypothetical protein